MTIMAKKKATLYVEIAADTKARMERLAGARRRKMNAEVEMALERYLAEEEAKEGIDTDKE